MLIRHPVGGERGVGRHGGQAPRARAGLGAFGPSMLLLAQKSGSDGLAAHTRFCPERHARDARTKPAVARAVVARAPVDEDASACR